MQWEVQSVGDLWQCVLLDHGRFIDRQGYKSWLNGKFYPWLWKSRLCANLICADLNADLKPLREKMLHPYPQDIFQGIDAVRRTTTIIRSGDIAANKVELGACVYTALGVAMKTGIGDFVDPAFGSAVDAEQETEMTAAVVELASEVESHSGQSTYGAADASSKINWRELFKTLLPLLLTLL